MPGTLTIRLSDEDRATLAVAAQARGEGLSTLVRQLAEVEARRLRDGAARAQIVTFAQAPLPDPELDAELTALADAPLDWPAWDGPLSAAWRAPEPSGT